MATVESTGLERDRVAAALRAAGYRVTSQRLLVAEALGEAGRHLSADEVLEAVGQRAPVVSLPTIYASLDALEDAGLVRRVGSGRGPALFDAGPVPHHHLVCRRCGSVADLEADVALQPALAAAAAHRFAPEGAEVIVRGLCAHCAQET